ncbi:hypothetical protein SDC9_108935 [bioreactor metagenome]|uniref:Uncharacterized protein n=1 Tax=bioreactor metagenome TaxID=1076179 RepID=A0A645B9B5_9ZZZZ|nr:hypothetical protein [Erysipelotrichales bacterium]
MKFKRYKKSIIIFIGIAMLFIIVLYYHSESIFFQKVACEYSIVSISKTDVDRNAEIAFSYKVLELEDKVSLCNLLKKNKIYYLYSSSFYDNLPYLPFTIYKLYFANEYEEGITLNLYENGELLIDLKSYVSFEKDKLFDVIDKFYRNLK